MRIRASVRPGGLRRGVTTKKWYQALGLKDMHCIDLRDVVGKLELNATGKEDTKVLTMLHKCLAGFPNPEGYVLKIFDKSGEEVASTDALGDAEIGGDE